MAANIRTIGLSGLARTPLPHDSPPGAETERLCTRSERGRRETRQAAPLKVAHALTALEEVIAVANNKSALIA